jgi:ribosomal subunit interface protein
MNKTIEPVNFSASAELQQEISDIFDKLVKFNDRIISADIYMKNLSSTPQGLKKVDVRVFLPGRDVFVEQEADSYVSAAQQAFDRLKILLRKEKEKAIRH